MKRFTNVVIAGAVLTLAGTAFADPYTDVLTLRGGNYAGRTDRDADGRDRPNDDLYPGAEHVSITPMAGNKLVMFGMGSYDRDAATNEIVQGAGDPVHNRVQMFCASTTLDPVQGPVLNTMKYVTNNDGDRYRNAHHPRALSIFGGQAVAVLYNYAPGNRARTYMQVYNSDCEPMSDVVEVMAKNNDDCSNSDANSVREITNDGTTARLVGVYGCNGNGEDDAWIGIQDITKQADGSYSINVVEDDIVAEQEEERTRGWTTVTNDTSFFTVCLTAGNTQPPNRGVVCSAYDTQSGQRLWRQYVARRDGDTYRTQIHVAGVTDQAGNPTNMAVATWEQLTETRRRNKGRVQLMSTSLRFTRDGMDILTQPRDDVAPTVDGTHLGMCNSLFGEEGSESWRAFLVGTSVNGNPASISTGQTVSWTDGTRALMADRKYALNTAIDNAWLSNIYGQNPNTQGRNFVACVGNVPNPGYQVNNGYQADVKSFVAVAATARRMDDARPGIAEDKLSTQIVLVPAVTAKDTPAAGEPVDPDQQDPGTDPAPDPEPDPGQDPGNGDSKVGGVGGCNAGGSAPTGGLALLGFALLIGVRRRRNR